MNDEKTYTVTFRNYPNVDMYITAKNALEAIEWASDEMFGNGYSTPYLAPRVRVSVYKEWNNSANQYRNDGTFIR